MGLRWVTIFTPHLSGVAAHPGDESETGIEGVTGTNEREREV